MVDMTQLSDVDSRDMGLIESFIHIITKSYLNKINRGLDLFFKHNSNHREDILSLF